MTIPISADYIAEMERLNALNKNVYVDAIKNRKHLTWEGPSFVQKKAAFDQRKVTFKREWLSTLGILQSIQQQLCDYRPSWVGADVPAAWQVDQFLLRTTTTTLVTACINPLRIITGVTSATRKLRKKLS